MAMISLKISLLSALLALSTACSHFDFEKRIMQQGNLVTAEQIARLKKGQTREQVRSIMGDAVLIDTFNPNRLNYVYTLDQGKKQTVRKQVVIEFADDRVIRISE